MHIHILGICGTFMGGIAVLARAAGHRVTGCDANVYPPMSTQLTEQGIELIEGYSADQIALQPDLWVIGNVVTRGNALMEEILDRGLSYVSGPQWIGEHVLAGKWVLAVAGTHGKTTTASMLAWILEDAGLRPGFLIGGVPRNFGVSARLSGAPAPGQADQEDSSFFVIEADEYDTAFFDKRSKFVHYRPRTAVLNNLEFDHADIFPDLAAIETQFHHLVRTIPAAGRIIFNGRDDALKRVLTRGCWSETESFGSAQDWHMRSVDGETKVMHGDKACGVLRWNLQGEHNDFNALAAIAAARHAGVDAAQAIESLGRFASVRRRMELRGSVNEIDVYDDFAHHPTAIATTLAGLRKAGGARRILALLEPRSNTMKLGVMKAALPASLAEADLVFAYQASPVAPVMSAQPTSASAGWDLAEALAPLGERVAVFGQIDALVTAVCRLARPGDQIVVMSNGGFGGVHQKLLDALTEAAGRLPA